MSALVRRLKGAAEGAYTRLRSLVTSEVLVGSDANGNRYWKWTEKDHAGVLVERRRVAVPGGDLLYDPKVVPPEWRAWLARTRSEPPSEAEMQASAERAAVLRQRVAAIEEREAQRRIRRDAMGREAGGPDMGAFVSQLENKGYGRQQQQQQQQQQESKER